MFFVKMVFKDKIILCLDIDETVMNSKTKPYTLVDFNGSDKYGDASAWTSFLKKMIRYCEERSISLIVQIISAKPEALPDDTVAYVVKYFSEFLYILNKDGERVIKPDHSSKYILRRYRKDNHQEDLCCLRNVVGRGEETVSIKGELPPIHLCHKNKPGILDVSKAWVMKAISEHFKDPIPAKNMFMLDNARTNYTDIAYGSNGTTPCYQAVSAYELERLCYSSKASRTEACKDILAELERRIVARVNQIIASREVIADSTMRMLGALSVVRSCLGVQDASCMTATPQRKQPIYTVRKNSTSSCLRSVDISDAGDGELLSYKPQSILAGKLMTWHDVGRRYTETLPEDSILIPGNV